MSFPLTILGTWSPRPLQEAHDTLKQFPSLEEHHGEFMHLIQLLCVNALKNTQNTGERKEATREEDN